MAQTILLIDHDPDIRTVAQAALNRLDYLVLETADPQHAIRIAREQPIDLLLTDVVMPLMKATERLGAPHPGADGARAWRAGQLGPLLPSVHRSTQLTRDVDQGHSRGPQPKDVGV